MIECISNFYLFLCGLIVYILILYLIYTSDNVISKFLKKYIFSDVPFLQISDDSNFHTVESKKAFFDYRLSLFFVPFGIYKIYFITLYKKKIKMISILSFDVLMQTRFTITQEKIEQDYNAISQKLLLNEAENKKKSIEILKDNITLYSNIKNSTMTKSTIYIALLAAIVTMLLTKDTSINGLLAVYSQDNIYVKILFSYWLLMLANFLIFNLQLISVHNTHRETFDDFISKLNMDEVKYFYKNNCLDAFYSRKLVSYMRNIEIYLKKSLLLSIILLIVQI